MTPERHRHIGELYHRARSTPYEQRSTLLDDVCANDVDLRTEVESLLAADADAGGFMEAPALHVAAHLASLDARPAPDSIGRYRLLSFIGRGGMGEVYLAEDSALRRKVAIKLLPAPLIHDEQAVGRFEQEARAASSLNHPNIVTIYEIGTFDDGRFIAMEFVEGQPLSAAVGQPMAADRLLPIAGQLAQALAVAHTAGIVHRDIKPENIMVRPDGYLKLLDFGVARLGHAHLDATDPTFETRAGVIVGTPRYMSPEQIRGEVATAASDIFALGAVLHELATGRHPSESDTISDCSRDVDAASQPPAARIAAPATARRFIDLIRRMLAQDPGDRPSAAEIVTAITSGFDRSGQQDDVRRAEPEDPSPAASPTNASTPHTARMPFPLTPLRLSALATVAALAAYIGWHARQAEQANVPDYRFQIEPPPSGAFSSSSASFALSPDGRSFAFTATTTDSGLALWVQSMDSLKARKVRGTENAGQIFWAPDSRSVAFADTSGKFRLKAVDLAGDLVQPIGDVQLGPAGVGAWSRGNAIIVNAEKTLHLVPVSGGAALAVTALDASRGETNHRFPSILPDGRHFLFLAIGTEPEHDGVAYVAAIGSSERKRLFKSDSQVVYAPPGYLLYMLGSTLLARRFDARTLRIIGEPIVLAEEVQRNPGARRGAFTVSDTGLLAYRQHNETQLLWYDRGGRLIRTLGPPGHYRNHALSPDGKTMAVAKLDYRTGTWDIWTIDLERGINTRLTSDLALEDMPVWSPNGQYIGFISSRDRDAGASVYRQAPGSGVAELVIKDIGIGSVLHAWTSEAFVYSAIQTPNRDLDLWRVPLSGDRSPRQLLATRFWELFCQPSPDGRGMAYGSNETGVPEIYGAAYPSGSGKKMLSVGGGAEPAWRRDGMELFYLSAGRQLMSVAIAGGAELRGDPPAVLFQTALPTQANPGYTRNHYAVTADGQHFILNEPVRKSPSSVTVVVNWPALTSDSAPARLGQVRASAWK